MSAIISAIQPGIRSAIGSAFMLPSIDLMPEQVLMAIFAGGAKGAWYERANIATLFQESPAVTAVGASGQLVGMGLSREKGLALGPELWVPNEISADWIDNGGGSYTHTAGSSGTVRSAGAGIAVGRIYLAVWQVTGRTAGGVNLLIGNAGDGPFYTANGSFQGRIRGNGNSIIYLQPTASFNGSVSAISTREILGNHQVQATAGLKPIYQTGPKRVVFDGTDDVLNTTFSTALGANCTVVRAVPGTGVVITTGQNIGTSFADNTSAAALIIVDRALSAAETAAATNYGNQQLAL